MDGGSMLVSSLRVPDEEVRVGSRGPAVRTTYEHLRTLGYAMHAARDPDLFDDQLAEALKTYQRMRGLRRTGRVDAATIEAMSRPRCGVPDLIAGVPRAVVGAWPTPNLEYVWISFTSLIGRRDSLAAVDEAAAKWDAVSGLTLKRVQSSLEFLSPALSPGFVQIMDLLGRELRFEIAIGFFRGPHGDQKPFEENGVLGHGFFPTSDELPGDVHFNERQTAQRWNRGLLHGVAIHELGHAIGLGHSQNPESVMFRDYQGVTELSQEDIQFVQSLYGPP